jgi:hypothetical protein
MVVKCWALSSMSPLLLVLLAGLLLPRAGAFATHADDD